MEMDERIKSFKQTFPRPTEWDSAWKIVVKLVYDLIDDREKLRTRVGILTVACTAAIQVADTLLDKEGS